MMKSEALPAKKERGQRTPLVDTRTDTFTPAQRPQMVLGWATGLMLMAQVALITGNAAGRWTFKGHGVVVLLPTYLLILMLTNWLIGNELRGEEQALNIMVGRRQLNDRQSITVQQAMVVQAANRMWVLKVMILVAPVTIAFNIYMDLTRYNVSPWLVGGIFLGSLGILSMEGVFRRKAWWDDTYAELMRYIAEEEGEELDDDAL